MSGICDDNYYCRACHDTQECIDIFGTGYRCVAGSCVFDPAP
jgi:hypothetical protein